MRDDPNEMNEFRDWNLRGFNVYINPRTPGRYLDLVLFRLIPNDEVGDTWVLKELVWQKVSSYKDSTRGIAIDKNFAQTLADELWKIGIRPSEGTGSAGSLKATQDHLKDMQTVSFKLLDRLLERKD